MKKEEKKKVKQKSKIEKLLRNSAHEINRPNAVERPSNNACSTAETEKETDSNDVLPNQCNRSNVACVSGKWERSGNRTEVMTLFWLMFTYPDC